MIEAHARSTDYLIYVLWYNTVTVLFYPVWKGLFSKLFVWKWQKNLFQLCRPEKAEEQTNLGEKVVEPEEEDANETDKEHEVDDNSGQDDGSQVIDPQQVYKERRNMVIKLAFKCVELYNWHSQNDK